MYLPVFGLICLIVIGSTIVYESMIMMSNYFRLIVNSLGGPTDRLD